MGGQFLEFYNLFLKNKWGAVKKKFKWGGSQKDKVGGQFDFFFKSGGAVEKVPPHCHPMWETLITLESCKESRKGNCGAIKALVVILMLLF